METLMLPVPTHPLADLIPLVTDSVHSPASRRAYSRALRDFFAWYGTSQPGPFSKATVQQYRTHLETNGAGSSTVNQALSAIRKLATEAGDAGLLDSLHAQAIGKVEGIPRRGVRAGQWLTQAEAGALLALPDAATLRGTLRGKRDSVILALLMGCGLRRQEATCLLVSQVQARDGRGVIVDLLGKGQRVRTVPVPGWGMAAIEAWKSAAGITDGNLLRPVDKLDRVHGESMSAAAVWLIVESYARKLGIKIAPHDLRRTHAKLAKKGGCPIDQIQHGLGHSSIAVTQRYIGHDQDLTRGPCDYLGLAPLPPLPASNERS